jgi:hypothetical protein
MESHQGFDISLGSVNKSCSRSGTPGAENYNAAWNKLSGCNGNESCWQTHVEKASDTLWDYEVAHLGNFNLVLWSAPGAFPNITPKGGYDPGDIVSHIFQHANTNQPTGGIYNLANEALQPDGSWSAALQRYLGPPAPGALGAQMNKSYRTDCRSLQAAGTTHAPGAKWIEIYAPDFDACGPAIAAIASHLGIR